MSNRPAEQGKISAFFAPQPAGAAAAGARAPPPPAPSPGASDKGSPLVKSAHGGSPFTPSGGGGKAGDKARDRVRQLEFDAEIDRLLSAKPAGGA